MLLRFALRIPWNFSSSSLSDVSFASFSIRRDYVFRRSPRVWFPSVGACRVSKPAARSAWACWYVPRTRPTTPKAALRRCRRACLPHVRARVLSSKWTTTNPVVVRFTTEAARVVPAMDPTNVHGRGMHHVSGGNARHANHEEMGMEKPSATVLPSVGRTQESTRRSPSHRVVHFMHSEEHGEDSKRNVPVPEDARASARRA